MAASEVSICNSALTLLAANRITVLGDDTSVESMMCDDLYEEAVKEVLEAGDWSFATKRVQLSAITEAPLGYNKQSLLPGECIRVLGVWNSESFDIRGNYAKEGRYILTDFSPIFVKYIRYVDDPSQFSPLFVRAVYTNLAQKMCVPLTENQKRARALMEEAIGYLGEAATMDGLQGTQERFKSDAFIRVR